MAGQTQGRCGKDGGSDSHEEQSREAGGRESLRFEEDGEDNHLHHAFGLHQGSQSAGNRPSFAHPVGRQSGTEKFSGNGGESCNQEDIEQAAAAWAKKWACTASMGLCKLLSTCKNSGIIPVAVREMTMIQSNNSMSETPCWQEICFMAGE